LRPDRKGGRLDKTAVDLLIAEIDRQLGAQVNAILHHPQFQKLESAWRSLKYLVDQADFRENNRVEVLHCPREDLLEDFAEAPEIPKSGLYKIAYSNEYGTFGGQPYGLIAATYEFGPGPEDMELLRKCAAVAAMAHAPFVANASPRFFGSDDFFSV